MGDLEIPEPLAGWNPVPDDPNAMLWWDGEQFAFRATRVADGWEVAPAGEATDGGPATVGEPGARSARAATQPFAPPPPVPPVPPAGQGARSPVRRPVLVALVLVGVLAVGGGAFAAGWSARGDVPRRASRSVPTSCSPAEILGVVQDWSAARERWYQAEESSEEQDQAEEEYIAQEDRLDRTLVRCEEKTALTPGSTQGQATGRSYGTVGALRDAFVAAGGSCPLNAPREVDGALGALDCSADTVLSVYGTVERRDHIVKFAVAQPHFTLLVGPNWIVDSDVKTLRRVQAEMGGTLRVS